MLCVHIFRYLYHTDWGSDASVWRTELDGTEPELVQSGLDNPNGVVISNGVIYVIDSHAKTHDVNNPNYPRPAKNATVYAKKLSGGDWQEVAGVKLGVSR